MGVTVTWIIKVKTRFNDVYMKKVVVHNVMLFVQNIWTCKVLDFLLKLCCSGVVLELRSLFRLVLLFSFVFGIACLLLRNNVNVSTDGFQRTINCHRWELFFKGKFFLPGAFSGLSVDCLKSQYELCLNLENTPLSWQLSDFMNHLINNDESNLCGP